MASTCDNSLRSAERSMRHAKLEKLGPTLEGASMILRGER
jgi:hypothetical protein